LFTKFRKHSVGFAVENLVHLYLMWSCECTADDHVLLCRPDVGKGCLPLLHFIVDHGNVTVFEWRSGKQPTSIESIQLDFGVNSDEDDAAENVDNGEVGGLLFQLVYVGGEIVC